ncbi:MAG TPA: glycosyltransferase [Flavisolibacter sp.]|jgi:glycosyltransferase involved in cell wall biosynthesis|nr:glycosyltransferase [Flavisolibacter sp.]
MNEQPLVSVLITVYNDENHIAQAIESIQQQTYQHFEIVVVDDGSTDGTAHILTVFAGEDARIRVIRQPNGGTANAANNGIQFCKGKYIARLDSDDISYPNRLQEEVNFLEAHPEVGLVGGGCHIADANGRIIGTRNIITANPSKTLLNRCIYQQSDVMFRRDVLKKLQSGIVYRSKFKGAEDYDLWLRISEVAAIAKLDSIFGIWKLNTGGYTLSRKQEQLEAIRELKKMAKVRRKGKHDWYDEFRPKVKDAQHRTQMKNYAYDKVVAQVLLKETRTSDVREQLKKYKADQESWKAVNQWYYLSFLPKPVLQLLFGCREYLLNNSFIELR